MTGLSELQVLMNKTDVVGRLTLTQDNKTEFQYDHKWLANGYPISPRALPFKKDNPVFTAPERPFDGLFGVFADVLPESFSKIVWTEVLKKEKNLNYSALNPLEKLALAGDEGLGALTFYPETKILGGRSTPPDLNVVAAKMKNLRTTDNWDEILVYCGSIGGSRPKVYYRPPEDSGPEWIVKFPGEIDPDQGMGEMELLYNQAAEKCGLILPEYRLFENKYFGCRRFDRGPEGQRYHMISLAALLEADMSNPDLDYGDIFKLACELDTNDEETLWQIYRHMVFNVLADNCDDNVKNFAFIHDGRRWRYSPVYDITYPYFPNWPGQGINYHGLKIRGKDGVILMSDMAELAKICGLDQQTAIDIYESILPITDALKHQIKRLGPRPYPQRLKSE